MEFSDQFNSMENYINQLQDTICRELESLDTAKFKEDTWTRSAGGGGKTRVIENGRVFEKGGVNVSSVIGMLPESIAEVLNTEPKEFAACGISLVIHPVSPKVPTIHLNLRYFEMEHGRSWFGGGIDLTPYFPYPEDFTHFHKVLKEACDQIIPDSYQDYKKQCDDYFTIKHRNEMRGIGGIFFDYLEKDNLLYFRLIQSVGNSFLESYRPIVKKRLNESYTDYAKLFQLIRRGRYVEFNLIYDRGTLFGIKTNGRIESIFMSLPPEVKFIYNWQPDPGTPQRKMMEYYQPKNYLKN